MPLLNFSFEITYLYKFITFASYLLRDKHFLTILTLSVLFMQKGLQQSYKTTDMPIIQANSSGMQTEIYTTQYFLKMNKPKCTFVLIIVMIGIFHKINSILGDMFWFFYKYLIIPYYSFLEGQGYHINMYHC